MAIAHGAIIGSPNYLDSTFTGAGYNPVRLGSGDWLPERPLTNLIDPELAVSARSASLDLSATKLLVDLGVPREVDVISIPRGDFSRWSKARTYASNTPAWSGITVYSDSVPGDSLVVSKADEPSIGDLFSFTGHSVGYTIINVVDVGPYWALQLDKDLEAPVLAGTELVCGTGDFSAGVVGGTPSGGFTNGFSSGFSTGSVGGGFSSGFSNGFSIASSELMDGNVLLDTGWQDIWEKQFEFGTLPYGHPSLADGKLTPESAVKAKIPYVYICEETILARFWKIEIDDRLNQNGYLTLNRAMFLKAIEPPYGISYGANQTPLNETTKVSGPGSVDVFNVVAGKRVFSFNFNDMTVDESLVQMGDLNDDAGLSGQLLFIFDKSDKVHKHRRMMLCRLNRPISGTYSYFNAIGSSLELVEVTA